MSSIERLMGYLNALGIEFQVCMENLIKVYWNQIEVFSAYQMASSDDLDVRDDNGFLRIEECCLDDGTRVGVSMSPEKAVWYLHRTFFEGVPECGTRKYPHKIVPIRDDPDTCRCKICKATFRREDKSWLPKGPLITEQSENH